MMRSQAIVSRTRSLLRCAALAILLAFVVAPVKAAHAGESPVCAPQVKDRVADVTEHLSNWSDVGIDGHVWALTDVDIRIQIWTLGTNHFCVRRDIDGTFRSFAGVSPNLTGTISDGVTGTVDGTDWAVFTGPWAPRVPLSGFVGAFDVGCTQDGGCAAFRGVGYLFFVNGFQALHVRQYSLVYDGGDHGVWQESTRASTGDITG